MNLSRRVEVLEARASFLPTDMGPMPTLEDMAAGHLRQLAFTRACQTQRRVRIASARQIGKSVGIGQAFVNRCQRVAGSRCVLFGLNGVAVRENFWEPIVKTQIRRWGLRCAPWERMVVEFPNSSRILCTGTDDLAHVQNVLGNRFKGAILAIDEMQSQRPSAVRALLTTILPPTLTPESTIVLSGTIPETPGGFWWDLMQQESWDSHGWGRVELTEPMPEGLSFDDQIAHLERYLVSLNPHTPEAPQVLIQHLKDNKLTIADPTIQRDWFGNAKAFDPNARAYFFRPEINLYKATTPAWANELTVPSGDFVCAVPLPGIDTFAGSIDPGGGDPCGVEMIGWDSTGRVKTVQQVFSWVSARDHHLDTGKMFAVAGFANRHYPTIRWRIDSGAKQDVSHLQHDFGLPVVKAADRSDFEASLNRTNQLLKAGIVQVMDTPGNPLVTDFTSAQLDKEKLARGQHRWSSVYHPTASENLRYALSDYWPSVPPVPKARPPEDPFERMMAAKVAEAKRRPKATGPLRRTRDAG